MLGRILLLVGCVGWSVAAGADDARGNHAVWGSGQNSCNRFNHSQKDGQFEPYKHYLMGYLTAYNTLAEDTYNVAGTHDLNEIVAWLNTYCTKTPTDSFDHAMQMLIGDFRDSRLRASPSSSGWGKPQPKQESPPKSPHP